MNDSLRYLGREPIYRQYHHHEMTFAMAYAYSENFILPISHDEVVHGKGSMFERVPQDEWRKFGTLRAFYAFMWAHPGKKLLFMGTEFGQKREFSEARSIDWWQSAEWGHRGVQRLVKDLNQIYRDHPALWKRDTDPSGFSWIDADDRGGNVFSFLRYDGEGQMIACITNFSSEPRPDYRIGLPAEGVWTEILNTDADVYDGTGAIGNLGQVVAHPVPSHGYVASAAVTLPPLGAVWLRLEPTPDEEQAEPEKVTKGVKAAAKLASPHRSTAEEPAASSTPRKRPAKSAAAAKVSEPADSGPAGTAASSSSPDSPVSPLTGSPASPSRRHPGSPAAPARPRPEVLTDRNHSRVADFDIKVHVAAGGLATLEWNGAIDPESLQRAVSTVADDALLGHGHASAGDLPRRHRSGGPARRAAGRVPVGGGTPRSARTAGRQLCRRLPVLPAGLRPGARAERLLRRDELRAAQEATDRPRTDQG